MQKLLALLVVLAALVVGFFLFNNYIYNEKQGSGVATTFEECVAQGNAVMESYPRQCRDGEGNHFVENIGNEFEMRDLIRIDSPRPNQTITSPLTITGEARGYYFFEASFPVVLLDKDGEVLVEHFATAGSSWMTEEFVPFTATLEFEKSASGEKGTLILKRDNPSDLPENDASLEVPVIF